MLNTSCLESLDLRMVRDPVHGVASCGKPANDVLALFRENDNFPSFCGGEGEAEPMDNDQDLTMVQEEPQPAGHHATTTRSSLDYVAQNLQCRLGNYRNRCFANGPFRLWAWAGSFLNGLALWNHPSSGHPQAPLAAKIYLQKPLKAFCKKYPSPDSNPGLHLHQGQDLRKKDRVRCIEHRGQAAPSATASTRRPHGTRHHEGLGSGLRSRSFVYKDERKQETRPGK